MGDVVDLKRWRFMPGLSIFDVANAFLAIKSMTHKKLQKLCYYAYAWYLALFRKRLFEERFEAWIHGPVQPRLYDRYKEYGWTNIPRSDWPASIDEDTRKFLRDVYHAYGHLTGDQLELLAHSEDPWQQARAGVQPWEPSTVKLDDEVICSYYQGVRERRQSE